MYGVLLCIAAPPYTPPHTLWSPLHPHTLPLPLSPPPLLLQVLGNLPVDDDVRQHTGTLTAMLRPPPALASAGSQGSPAPAG